MRYEFHPEALEEYNQVNERGSAMRGVGGAALAHGLFTMLFPVEPSLGIILR
jgi:hypothetical protein